MDEEKQIPRKLVTFEDLRVALGMYALSKGVEKWAPTDENVLWFVAMEQAEEFRDMGLKGIASAMLHGCEPLTKDSVEGWLEQFYHDPDPEDWPNWEPRFRDFFGK